jgi:hypothetical protein
MTEKTEPDMFSKFLRSAPQNMRLFLVKWKHCLHFLYKLPYILVYKTLYFLENAAQNLCAFYIPVHIVFWRNIVKLKTVELEAWEPSILY